MITDRLAARDVTPDDIQALIATRQPELNELEYKQQANDPDLLKAACAIANFGGGFIVVGIAEDSEHYASAILSIDKPQQSADSIRQTLRDGLSPRPHVEVVPLLVGKDNVIVIRVAPQNPPHMVSANKRSDFYGRYDATSDRMRYEEIEQRFRDRLSLVPSAAGEPSAVIESISGRQRVSQAAADVLNRYAELFKKLKDPTLGIAIVQDGATAAVDSNVATAAFKRPSYNRQGGWLIIHPSLEFLGQSGEWYQDYGEFGRTSLNASGDLLFQKGIDSVLCWRQGEEEFRRAPRLYSNALVEYCLSYMYSVSDIICETKPRRLLLQTFLVNAQGVQLPLGEGGSVWYDAPSQAPAFLTEQSHRSLPAILSVNGPLRIRHEAFKLAAQFYSFFGYSELQVPFSRAGAITFEGTSESSGLAAIVSYLQGRLGTRVFYVAPDNAAGTFWFELALPPEGKRRTIGASEEFLYEAASDEDKLFTILDQIDIENAINSWTRNSKPLLVTSGLKMV